MEGSWRALAAWLAATLAGCALMIGAGGCGGGDDGESSAAGPAAVKTANPERAFAPLVELAADEPWRPMDARWFIERSVLWYVDDHGCGEGEVAVGHTMPEKQNEVTDWIFPNGLGAQRARAYYRVPYDPKCEVDLDRRVYADQLVRPLDPAPRTPAGARRGEGFYLDLVDEAREGQPVGPGGVAAPIYAERTDEGDSGVRLTYWMLFGMHGEPGAPNAHEGDWERVDVLLHDHGDDSYEPRTVQVGGDSLREVPWSALRRADGSHPVVTAARATHTLAPADRGDRCAGCVEWATWDSVADAREQPWYGFGGAWGELGRNSATTGPLGPHGFFPSDAEKARENAGGTNVG